MLLVTFVCHFAIDSDLNVLGFEVYVNCLEYPNDFIGDEHEFWKKWFLNVFCIFLDSPTNETRFTKIIYDLQIKVTPFTNAFLDKKKKVTLCINVSAVTFIQKLINLHLQTTVYCS